MGTLHGKEKEQKILIWLSLFLATIWFTAFVYFMGLFPPPSPSKTLEEVMTIYMHDNLKFRIGAVLMMFTSGFYLPWALVLSIQLARVEKGVPIWAILQALAAPGGVLLFLLPAIEWGVAAFDVNRDPGIVNVMHQFAWLTFVAASSIIPFQIAPIAVVGLSRQDDVSSSPFPRWLGWLAAWLTITSSMGSVAMMFKSGIFAWNGLVPFYLPLTAFGPWMTCQAILLFRALNHQERAAAAS